MKKFLIILLLAIAPALGMSQSRLYFGGSIGGNFGIGSGGHTTVSILPEIGYRITSGISLGVMTGYEFEKEDGIKSHAFVLSPYVRCMLERTDWINVFVDGTARLKSTKVVDYDTYTVWQAGIRPGFSVNLGSNVSFVATAGFLGYRHYSASLRALGFDNKSGFDISTDNINVGFCVGF